MLQDWILRTRSCGTGFSTHLGWLIHFRHANMIRWKCSVQLRFQLPDGISAGLAFAVFTQLEWSGGHGIVRFFCFFLQYFPVEVQSHALCADDVCIDIHMNTPTRTRTLYLYIHTYMYMYRYMYPHMCTCAVPRTRINTHTHTHTHKHTKQTTKFQSFKRSRKTLWNTGWRGVIGCLILQVISRKRAL